MWSWMQLKVEEENIQNKSVHLLSVPESYLVVSLNNFFIGGDISATGLWSLHEFGV